MMSTNRVHEPASSWSVQKFRRGTLDGSVWYQVRFPTDGGHSSELTVPRKLLRHPRDLIDLFEDRVPLWPRTCAEDDKARAGFLKALIENAPSPYELIPMQTGFVDKAAFATHSHVVQADGQRRAIPLLDRKQYIDVVGTREGAEQVLKLALHSSYLAFAIGVSLAAPLISYLRLRQGEAGKNLRTLPESATFNFSGKSASGKSSLSCAALSMVGSPRRAGTFNFSARGLAEAAAESNDLLMVLDDAEKIDSNANALAVALQGIVSVTGGQSKRISRGADPNALKPLSWSTFIISSSHIPISQLADKIGYQLTAGDQARVFNITVPGPKSGGIFDRLSGSKKKKARKSVRLIAKLTSAYQNNTGHVFPEWIAYLIRKDRSVKIERLVKRFTESVVDRTDGWEVRSAEKFGYVYAAMRLAVTAKILPWPKKLPLEVAKHCYFNARRCVQLPGDTSQRQQLRELGQLRDSAGRVAVVTQNNGPVRISDKCIALEFQNGGERQFGLLPAALVAVVGADVTAQKALISYLKAEGVIEAGAMSQRRANIVINGQRRDRVRVWHIKKGLLKPCRGRASGPR